jgi:hypothetical protein
VTRKVLGVDESQPRGQQSGADSSAMRVRMDAQNQ